MPSHVIAVQTFSQNSQEIKQEKFELGLSLAVGKASTKFAKLQEKVGAYMIYYSIYIYT